MLASILALDLSPLLQFVFTALLLALGLLHFVKAAASRYLVSDDTFVGPPPSPDMPPTSDFCFVCSSPSNKKCSRCKAIRYCSITCQSKHWKEDHKAKCKDLRHSGGADTLPPPTPNSACGRWKVSLVPARGTFKVLKQPKKVLFAYEEFVRLFHWEASGFAPCGLLNCGNSCFANVILQCLASTKPLVAFLLEKGHSIKCYQNDWCFLCELQSHICRVSQSFYPFSPINILSRLPNIGGNLGYGNQEDAHEFMRFAIDTMQSVCLDEFGGEKVLDPSTQETTLIQHIFGGHLQSQVICTECDKISYRYENMMDLTVEIQGDATSLEDCLDQFTVKEWLDGENMYKCDGCNDYVKAWKRLTIHQAPNILTIALKRFQSGRFGKLNKRVMFPETLDLSPYMSEVGDGTDVYNLYAVVIHVDMLNASFFGHYVCYTKDFSGKWYRIDDCKVINVELEEVLAQGAYMLLYNRTSARQPRVRSLDQSSSLGRQSNSAKVSGEPLGVSVDISAKSVTTSGCLPSEICTESSASKSCQESELLQMVDPVKVASKRIVEDCNGPHMGHSISSSSCSMDLSEKSLCSEEVRIEGSTGSASLNVLPIQTSTADSVKPGIPSVDCWQKEETGPQNSQHEKFQFMESSVYPSFTHMVPEMCVSVSPSSFMDELTPTVCTTHSEPVPQNSQDENFQFIGSSIDPSFTHMAPEACVSVSPSSSMEEATLTSSTSHSEPGPGKESVYCYPSISAGGLDSNKCNRFLETDSSNAQINNDCDAGQVTLYEDHDPQDPMRTSSNGAATNVVCNGSAASLCPAEYGIVGMGHDTEVVTFCMNRNSALLDFQSPSYDRNANNRAEIHHCQGSCMCNGLTDTSTSNQNAIRSYKQGENGEDSLLISGSHNSSGNDFPHEVSNGTKTERSS